MVWGNPLIEVFGFNKELFWKGNELIEAQGGTAWHEIGTSSYIIVPFESRSFQIDTLYLPGRRVRVSVFSERGFTNHLVADFVIESLKIEEMSLTTGGITLALRVEGRPLTKELTHYAVNRRCISRRGESAENAATVTKNTLTMGAGDKASSLNTGQSLVGWTVEMADGAWSQIVTHDQANGVFTIEPEWSTYKEESGDQPESGIPPAGQKWQVYGALPTLQSGPNNDLAQAMSFAKNGWKLQPEMSASATQNGTFVTPNGANLLKTLQVIAQQSGEFFRTVPGERAIIWTTGVPAITHPMYSGALIISSKLPLDYNVARPLPGMSAQIENYETVTRIKPTGDGGGDSALTLKDLPAGFTPAAGYTIQGEYLVYTAGEANGIEIAREISFPLIGQANDGATSKAVAAKALYNAALVWLKEHDGPRSVIEVEVDSPLPIAAVSTVRLEYPDLVQSAYATVYVLESVASYKEGRVTYRLTLSGKKAPYMNDARIVAEALVASGTREQSRNVPQRNSRLLGGTKTIIEGGGVDPGTHTHSEYTLSSTFATHTADASAHHAPVTAGNATISVAGQAVAVQLAGTSGLQATATGLALNDLVAGQGLAISNKVINVGAPTDSGLVIGGDSVSMGTPGTLNATTTSVLSGSSHFHAITNTTNAKTTPNTLLRGDVNGDVAVRFATMDKAITPEIETAAGNILLDPASNVVQVDGNLSFVGARVITNDTGAVTLAPAGNLIVGPAGNLTTINPSTTVQTANYTSGFLGNGWGIQYDGSAEFRKLQADELHVQAFIADTARVQVGETWVTPSMALISRSFTVPGVGQTGQLFVEDAPGFADTPVFDNGDWLLLRIVDRTGGGLVVANVWGTVAGYTDQTNGEQRWTWTTRQSSVTGATAQRGAVALSFGKAGSGWVRTTTLDTAGAPYMGVSTWSGANPYTAGNRRELVRLGQLSGMTGRSEWGLRAGLAQSNHVTFTDLRSEIHNARLSLYAGNGATLRVGSAWVEVNGTPIRPNADVESLNATSTTTNYWSTIDEATNSYVDYVANEPNRNATVTVALANPTFTTLNTVTVRAYTQGAGFATVAPIDTIRLYAQVFAADGVTALTSEILLRTATTSTNADSTALAFPQFDAAATAATWAGAVLRLRWEYETNVASEAIRLDPAAPSIAVGSPLPLGIADGGDGFWVGRAVDGVYKLRLGAASGASLRYDGSNLLLRDSAGVDVIRLTNTGASEFAGPMTIGLSGGIWQGTGTFAVPTQGIKLFSESVPNVGTIGRLATYNAGVQQIAINTDGSLTAGAGAVKLDADGLNIISPALAKDTGNIRFFRQGGTTAYGFISGMATASVSSMSFIAKTGTYQSELQMYISSGVASTKLSAGTTNLEMQGNLDYAMLTDADFYIRDRGLAVGYPDMIGLNRGQIASDFAGEHSFNALVLQDTGVVAHGMTGIVGNSTYGWLGKLNSTNGGLTVGGASEGFSGLWLRGYTTGQDTTTAATTVGTVMVDGYLKSGTSATALATNAALLVVRNNAQARMIVRGNGDILSDSSASVTLFDRYDDVALLRSLSVALNPAEVVRNEWDRFVTYNRGELEAAGILDGSFVNQTALGRLLTGAVWQLHSRIAELEKKL